jgi:hypothetical protein
MSVLLKTNWMFHLNMKHMILNPVTVSILTAVFSPTILIPLALQVLHNIKTKYAAYT